MNVSIIFLDEVVDDNEARGVLVGENYETLECRLGDVVSVSLSMIMFHEDPLLMRVNKIIDRLATKVVCNYWISLSANLRKLCCQMIAIVHPLDGYYSFNLYHMQHSFYVFLLVWCLCTLCFLFELMYNRGLGKGFRN